MGLKLTLGKENNFLYHDFIDAYWRIEDISYTTTMIGATLKCYPSREASKMSGTMISPSLHIGGTSHPVVLPSLYRWDFSFKLSEVFENGIPLDSDTQITAIYNKVKDFTKLPFEDVLEETRDSGV